MESYSCNLPVQPYLPLNLAKSPTPARVRVKSKAMTMQEAFLRAVTQ